jgi:peptidoglycan/LPS O-acetylase OafA/YrhL
MRHSANLDVLRSIAVSVVVADHLILSLAYQSGLPRYGALDRLAFYIGQTGVLAFFVHTSLVLMYSLERMTGSPGHVTLHFYLRRFFRIYPLAVFCIALVLILHIPATSWWDKGVIVTPSVILSNLLLAQNIFGKGSVLAPLWSLPYEVQMYLVLPALYYVALRKRAVAYLCGLLAFFCCLGFLLFWQLGNDLNIAEYVPCFLSGILCYVLRKRIRQFMPAAFWPIFLFLLISGYCIARHRYETWSFWIGWLFCLFLGLAINTFRNSANRPLNVVAEKIALYSYGVYLVHIPILYLVFEILGIKSPVLGSLLFAVLTMTVSVVTYHLIEFPCIDLGRRLSSWPVRPAVPVPAQEVQRNA